MFQRVTMRQVAAAAKVSVATVSRVISGHPHVTSDATARVRAALEKLDYRPDPALRAIASCRWQGRRARSGEVIAWLDYGPDKLGRPPPEALAAAEREGFRIEHFMAGRYESARKLGDVLTNRGISGLVVTNSENTPTLLEMPWERFCAVAHGVAYAHNPVDTVRFNPFETVQQGVRKLVAAGARRIGLVLLHGAHGLTATNDKMIAAFEYAARAEPAVGTVAPLVIAVSRENARIAREWFGRERPDGILGHHEGVFWWLTDGAVRFPRDAMFVAMQLSGEAGVCAGFRNLREQCARVAVEQVMLRLRMNQRGVSRFPMDYVLSPQWTSGRSCPEQAAREELQAPR